MIKNNVHEKYCYIGNRKEIFVLDSELFIIMDIIKEITDSEQNVWLKRIFTMIQHGDSDIKIIMHSPIERTKYYIIKEKFINKIYQCCIYKGLVNYNDILNENIG